jgi:phenylalanyl-tRNA synthetase beta chain
MNISLNWLSQYVDISGLSVDDLAERLTMAGIEVEAIEENCPIPKGVVVGEVLERNPHPDADKLSVCSVNVGGEAPLQIVCGAPNCDAGKKVPVATIGTTFIEPDGSEFNIKKSKLRGVKSFGMMCSGKELGLSDDHHGLLELSDDSVVGLCMREQFPGDVMYEVEITPNRPDWLSHWGVARDVSCLLNSKPIFPEYEVPAPSENKAPENLVTVLEPELCPRYTARLIEGVTVTESPEWLKERLISIGMRPINNIVDITNFVLMELGQPLHAFDRDKLAEGRIVVRRANAGETMTLLDESELKLKDSHLLICDAEYASCLAGVMGGVDSGVVEGTTNVLLESAMFNPSNIRATSRGLGISTDSSYRFERGVDWDMVKTASDRAAALILEIAGGKLVSDLVDVQGEPPKISPVVCRFEKIRKLTGLVITDKKIIEIFRTLGLHVDYTDGEKCAVTPPYYRLDISREADLAEEVARIRGLDAIPEVPVISKTVASIKDDAGIRQENVNEALISLGLYECIHYSLVSEKSALADNRFTKADVIHIDNPLSLELECMRPSLFGEMLETMERNVSRKNYNLRIFEMGNACCANSALYPEERQDLCIVLTGQRNPERFSDELAAVYDFYDLKGLLESLFEKLGISNYAFDIAEDDSFTPGCGATVSVRGKTIGRLGKLADAYTKGLRTEYPVYVAQLDADVLINYDAGRIFYQAIPVYPSTTRDVAFVADKSLKHDTVIKFIGKAKLKNLEKVQLFDIFEDDEHIGPNRRSMAYTLTFRNPERTLTDKEVNKPFEKLRKKLADELKVELR